MKEHSPVFLKQRIHLKIFDTPTAKARGIPCQICYDMVQLLKFFADSSLDTWK